MIRNPVIPVDNVSIDPEEWTAKHDHAKFFTDKYLGPHRVAKIFFDKRCTMNIYRRHLFVMRWPPSCAGNPEEQRPSKNTDDPEDDVVEVRPQLLSLRNENDYFDDDDRVVRE